MEDDDWRHNTVPMPYNNQTIATHRLATSRVCSAGVALEATAYSRRREMWRDMRGMWWGVRQFWWAELGRHAQIHGHVAQQHTVKVSRVRKKTDLKTATTIITTKNTKTVSKNSKAACTYVDLPYVVGTNRLTGLLAARPLSRSSLAGNNQTKKGAYMY